MIIEKLKALWARVTIHWAIVATAFVAALPSILDYLGFVDITPILTPFMSEETARFIVSVLPFILAFVRPLIVLAPNEPE